MKHYKSYMDRVQVPEDLHDKLLDLEEPQKLRRPAWRRYGALAACGLLLVGVGVWAVARHTMVPVGPTPVNSAAPSAPAIGEVIDLAPEDPNGAEPGMKTIPGFEVRENRAGMDVVSYHMLPWIDYGSGSNWVPVEVEWQFPEGGTERDLTADEITAFLGGAEAVDVHLDWSAYELRGRAVWYADGSLWGAFLRGYAGPLNHFEFDVMAGEVLPSGIRYPDSVEQEIWGVTVFADKHDSEIGCDRRVSFMKDGYGYRFELTSTDAEGAERLVSRAVTHIAVGDGLSFYTVTGEEPPAPTPGGPAESNPTAAPSVGPQGASAEPYDPDKG